MAKMSFSKEKLEGRKPLPSGVYDFRMDGFKPKLSKAGDSVNLYPQLIVVNHPVHNDFKLYYTMNTGGVWTIRDFCHAFGVDLEDNEADIELPGDWLGLAEFPKDPSKWQYVGPLTGRVGKLEIIESTFNNRPTNDVKKFFCVVPGCTVRHSENLIKATK